MDYKAMWEELREKLNADLEFYKDGSQCSFLEAIEGEGHAEDMLRTMDTMESKYKIEETN